MTTKDSELREITCLAGVESAADNTLFATNHWTFADKVRFVNGVPRKIGGHSSFSFDNSNTILGCARTIFSKVINERVYTIIGTNKRLYSLQSSRLTNITPLKTTTIAIANSLATHYDTLANNPITTVNGSPTVTIADSGASRYVAGDSITLSGATATGGILAASFNATHIIRSAGASSYTINVGSNATSSTTGGGAAVIRSSGLIRVTKATHGMAEGDRVKITLAANTGGILAADINKEFIIRNVASGTFDIFTDGVATSSVSSAGGAATLYQEQISAGNLDAMLGQGYGAGLYGSGLYGVSKTSTSGIQYPRIWFCDKFGEKIIMTAGNQTGLYEWDGTTGVAPTLISGAPTAINYAFSSNNIVVTVGASNFGNHIFTSDINNFTSWTSSSTNQVFEDYIEGAGRFITHLSVGNTNILFTEEEVYTFSYIGLPLIWDIKRKTSSAGIISPMARCVVNDTAYWMDDKNFYMWRGGDITIIPSNSTKQATILRYVFDNLNFGQKYKSFAWYNRDYNEIWFHYPSANSTECDRIARVCLDDYSWVMDTSDRVSAEYPDISLNQPRLAKYSNLTSVIYRHETGTDDDTSALSWQLSTNLRNIGKNTASSVGIIPDANQIGDVSLNFKGYLFPQSQNTTFDNNFTISPTTERVTTMLNGRYWKYTFSGSSVGQSWTMGKWQEYLQNGSSN